MLSPAIAAHIGIVTGNFVYLLLTKSRAPIVKTMSGGTIDIGLPCFILTINEPQPIEMFR